MLQGKPNKERSHQLSAVSIQLEQCLGIIRRSNDWELGRLDLGSLLNLNPLAFILIVIFHLAER